VLEQIQIVLHPFLAFGFELLKWVELDFILPCGHILGLYVIFLSELFKPKRRPDESDISN
jgi:hypothetical protein